MKCIMFNQLITTNLPIIFVIKFFQDQSFVDILNSNAHVTLIRNSKKEKEATLNTVSNDESCLTESTFRSKTRTALRSDDSFEFNTDDWWNRVSDESFLALEKQCQSPKICRPSLGQNDTTLLFDIEEPSELNDTSVFESPSKSIFSPIKLVAMRRPSTIIEESTIGSINSSDECSDIASSSAFKQSDKNVAEQSVHSIKTTVRSYRPSLVNVFPTKTRIGFYDNLETMISSNISSTQVAPNAQNEKNKDDSICLINLDDTIEDVSSSNVSADQDETQNYSMDDEPPDQFNDTLEAVDYYMMQGKKILDKTLASASIIQPHAASSPKNRNNSLLKQTLARRHLMSIYGDNQ